MQCSICNIKAVGWCQKRTDINYRKLSSNGKEKWRVLRRLNPDYSLKLLSLLTQLTLLTSNFYRRTSNKIFNGLFLIIFLPGQQRLAFKIPCEAYMVLREKMYLFFLAFWNVFTIHKFSGCETAATQIHKINILNINLKWKESISQCKQSVDIHIITCELD